MSNGKMKSGERKYHSQYANERYRGKTTDSFFDWKKKKGLAGDRIVFTIKIS